MCENCLQKHLCAKKCILLSYITHRNKHTHTHLSNYIVIIVVRCFSVSLVHRAASWRVTARWTQTSQGRCLCVVNSSLHGTIRACRTAFSGLWMECDGMLLRDNFPRDLNRVPVWGHLFWTCLHVRQCLAYILVSKRPLFDFVWKPA